MISHFFHSFLNQFQNLNDSSKPLPTFFPKHHIRGMPILFPKPNPFNSPSHFFFTSKSIHNIYLIQMSAGVDREYGITDEQELAVLRKLVEEPEPELELWSMPTSEYLAQTVVSPLHEAMSVLEQVRPADPV